MSKATADLATTDLATIPQGFQFPVLSDEFKAELAEEMSGLVMEFQKIKMPSGGQIAFEIAGDNPEDPDVEKALVGIVVDHHPSNVLFEGDYDGEKKTPLCSSVDGKFGVDIQTGKEKSCLTCPMNEFGSGDDGRGKACKNGHNIYLLREGESFPLLLVLPPTSRKPFNSFMTKRLIGKGLLSSAVITKITLKKEKNAGGIEYAQAVFAVDRLLTAEERTVAKAYATDIKKITRAQPEVQAATITDLEDIGTYSEEVM
jgi:hypothetical protein